MNYQSITFQVTLPSGAVATNPRELEHLLKLAQIRERPVFTSDGRVLVPPTAPAGQPDSG